MPCTAIPLFYEPLGVDRGHRVLEVGLGSGYGAALAREIVGADGLVVSVEIDQETFALATDNLIRAGYDDIVLVQGDGGAAANMRRTTGSASPRPAPRSPAPVPEVPDGTVGRGDSGGQGEPGRPCR